MWSIDLLLGGNWVCYQRCRSLMAHVLTFYTLSLTTSFSPISLYLYLAPSLLLHSPVSSSYPLTFNLSLFLLPSVCLSFSFFLLSIFLLIPSTLPLFFHYTPLICYQFKKTQLAWLLIRSNITKAVYHWQLKRCNQQTFSFTRYGAVFSFCAFLAYNLWKKTKETKRGASSYL